MDVTDITAKSPFDERANGVMETRRAYMSFVHQLQFVH